MFHRRFLVGILVFVSSLAAPAVNAALPLSFDFKKAEVMQGWVAVNDVANLRRDEEGLSIDLTGLDPYFQGPILSRTSLGESWLTLRVYSEVGGEGELFYFQTAPKVADSVRFTTLPERWTEVRIPLPALAPRSRLRIDPPGVKGIFRVASLSLSERVLVSEPRWLPPVGAEAEAKGPKIASGKLIVRQPQHQVGAFQIEVAGELFAAGHDRVHIGILREGKPHWFVPGMQQDYTEEVSVSRGVIQAIWSFRDGDGMLWRGAQKFSPAPNGAVRWESEFLCEGKRELLFFPMMVVCPGFDRFREAKGQGLFAGVEYLDNEPSSSEADLRGPASKRVLPPSFHVTFPLMALQIGERWFGMIWDSHSNISPIFDSPDRHFQSGSHVLALSFPANRNGSHPAGSIAPYHATSVQAGEKVSVGGWFIGGLGKSIVPAVQDYVARKGLPEITVPPSSDYYALAASGWTRSHIGSAGLYQHAFWPGFSPAPAADAALYQEWLAPQLKGVPELQQEVNESARLARSKVSLSHALAQQVGHIPLRGLPLHFGHVKENAKAAEVEAAQLLKRFNAMGQVPYLAIPGKENYASTHFENHANGLTAQVLSRALEKAVFSGNRQLIVEALERVDSMSQYDQGVPRGAQTWEIPLHTPDILASAHLVHLHTLAYELTRKPVYLERAKYWAWTGVPFIYLTRPVPGEVGPFSTIAVLGATAWQAPVWIGQPVQWCGLVYADALYRLSRHDAQGPWKKLAQGITVAGIQHTWTSSDAQRVGLLPDYFVLEPQLKDGPAINPGTLQINAIQLYGAIPLSDYVVSQRSGVIIHAPGRIDLLRERSGELIFKLQGWSSREAWTYLSGLGGGKSEVRAGGKPLSPFSDPTHGRWIGSVPSGVEITVRF